jgi:hypothetical protein
MAGRQGGGAAKRLVGLIKQSILHAPSDIPQQRL